MRVYINPYHFHSNLQQFRTLKKLDVQSEQKATMKAMTSMKRSNTKANIFLMYLSITQVTGQYIGKGKGESLSQQNGTQCRQFQRVLIMMRRYLICSLIMKRLNQEEKIQCYLNKLCIITFRLKALVTCSKCQGIPTQTRIPSIQVFRTKFSLYKIQS